MNLLRGLFDTGGFMSHGYCYLWNRSLVSLHLFSDLIIGVSYVAISLTLLYLVRRAKEDMPFHWMFIAFGAFIIACGGTHFMEVWTLWTPVYWLSGAVKVVTALASATTALALPPLIPRSLSMIHAAKLSDERARNLERANAALRREVGERKSAEEEVRRLNAELEDRVRRRTAELEQSGESVRQLAAVVESSTDAIIGRDLSGVVTSWNRAAERMFGYTAAEMKGTDYVRVVPPELEQEYRDVRRRLVDGEQVQPYESVRFRKDGTRLPVFLTLSPVRDNAGKISGTSTIARDITERKRADEMLHLTVEAAPNAMVMADDHGKIVLVNSQTEALFGYAREELLGRRVDILVPPKYRDRHPAYRAEFMSDPLARAMGAGRDLYGLRKDGSEFPVEIGLNPIRTAQGTWVLSAIVDITERKHIDEQLRETQKLESLGLLAGGVAHDFNNLLVGIMGNTSLALETLPAASPDRLLLQEVLQASERLSGLTRQLLAYAGKGRFVVVKIDLSELVREISGLIRTSIPKLVQLRLELNPHLPVIEADPSQIQQLIMNLVINGAEAIGEENAGTVLVTTELQMLDSHYISQNLAGDPIAPGEYVAVEVHDTGLGMTEEVKARIFDPFFTTKFMGRGLGLAAVLGIVRSHQGTIRVYSELGKGSTFKVLLPAADGRVTRPEPEGAHDLRGVGTILVVDDEEIVRRLAKSALERYGYTVIVAEDGKTGVEALSHRKSDISLVLLDMTMPVMSGEEAFRQIRMIAPEVRVVLSSGYNEVEAIRRFTNKGLAGFIQKPYTPAELARKVKTVLTSERTE
ncbi:MAG TPA: PAS domain S-box protein [Bryobacteraceae bacterium]|nr:PAS domain S-box protein [Bryobacteraceae bacterium]